MYSEELEQSRRYPSPGRDPAQANNDAIRDLCLECLPVDSVSPDQSHRSAACPRSRFDGERTGVCSVEAVVGRPSTFDCAQTGHRRRVDRPHRAPAVDAQLSQWAMPIQYADASPGTICIDSGVGDCAMQISRRNHMETTSKWFRESSAASRQDPGKTLSLNVNEP